MIRQSVVDRLASANERLQAALIAGDGTMPHRTLIARLVVDLAQLDATARTTESLAIAKAANEQSNFAASIVENADGDIAATLAKHAAPTYQPIEPDNMTTPAISAAAKALAAAETKYAAAGQFFSEAASRTAGIQSRLSDIETAGASIREQRSSGQLADREAAGLITLNLEDAADLRKLLAVAEQEQNSLVQNAEPVRLAQEALNHAVKAATFDALSMRAKEAEAAFLAVVADVYLAGRSMGRSAMLGSSWIPSKELNYLITAGQPPINR